MRCERVAVHLHLLLLLALHLGVWLLLLLLHVGHVVWFETTIILLHCLVVLALVLWDLILVLR